MRWAELSPYTQEVAKRSATKYWVASGGWMVRAWDDEAGKFEESGPMPTREADTMIREIRRAIRSRERRGKVR